MKKRMDNGSRKTRLPAWYPLETYGRELSAEEWASELYIRLALRIAYRNCKGLAQQHAGPITMGQDGGSPTEAFIAVLSDQAPSRKGRFIFDDDPSLSRDWPINVQSAFETEFAAQLLRSHANPEHIEWAQQLAQRRETHVEFIASGKSAEVLGDRTTGWDNLPPDDGQYWRDVVGPRVPLMVNLNLDDESLRTAFDVWLMGMRQQLSGECKVPFDETDFKKWHKYKVLQVFDIDLWMEMTGEHMTDAVIGRGLWPEDDARLGEFDRTDRLRKYPRKINEKLFTPWECERLVHQVRLIKFAKSICQDIQSSKEVE